MEAVCPTRVVWISGLREQTAVLRGCARAPPGTTAYAVAGYPAGLLADRIGRPGVFAIGLVFFAVGYTGLGLTTDGATAWLLIGVYGVFTGCTDGVGKAWISSLAGPDVQASAQGMFSGRQRVCRAGRVVGGIPVAEPTAGCRCLISGIAGGVFAVALIAITLRRPSIPFSVRMTCCR